MCEAIRTIEIRSSDSSKLLAKKEVDDSATSCYKDQVARDLCDDFGHDIRDVFVVERDEQGDVLFIGDLN